MGVANAKDVIVPAGTPIFVELQQRLTSKKGIHRAGDPARAAVWRDVVVDGKVVIAKGTSVRVKISSVKPKRLTGRRGSLKLEALHVTATDGTNLILDGGYDNSGHDRVALTSSLISAFSWSATMLKGKDAVLPPGTIFDAQVKLTTAVEGRAVQQATDQPHDFSANVLYDAMTDKAEHLPLNVRRCGIVIGDAAVRAVNEKPLKEPVRIEILDTRINDKCVNYRARVDLRRLGKHFGPGINRFDLTSQGEQTTVLLTVEL